MILLNILLKILLIFIILLSIIILIPYKYIINGNSDESKVDISILWLFGMLKLTFVKYIHHKEELSISLFNLSKNIKIDHNKETKAKDKIKEKSSKKKSVKLGDHINKQVIQEFFLLLKKASKKLKPSYIFVDARIGFNDPMYTGLLYGLYCQFSNLYRKHIINIQPSFAEEVFDGQFSIRGSVWVLNYIIYALGFLISKPIRNEIKLIRKERGGAQYVWKL